MPKTGVVIKRIDGVNPMLGSPKTRFLIERPNGNIKRITEDGIFKGINVGDRVITSWTLFGWDIEKIR